MKGIKRSPDGGYLLAFDTPKGPKRLQAKVAVCTAPAHRLSNVEGLRVSEVFPLIPCPFAFPLLSVRGDLSFQKPQICEHPQVYLD